MITSDVMSSTSTAGSGSGSGRKSPRALLAKKQKNQEREVSRNAKFAECSPKCLNDIHAYYRQDFAFLQYPVSLEALDPLAGLSDLDD